MSRYIALLPPCRRYNGQNHKWSGLANGQSEVLTAHTGTSHKRYNGFLSIGTDEAEVLSPLVSQIKSIVDWYVLMYLPVQTADVMTLDGVEVVEVVDEVTLQHEWSW